MRAKDIMTTPVITVRAGASIKETSTLLATHGFTAAPVTDEDDRLIGIVTEADLIKDRILPDPRSHMIRDTSHHERPPMTVGEVMTTPVEGMTPGADAADLARMMVEEGIRSIPIVDGAAVVGIVSRRDLLRTLIRDDETIAADVRHQLRMYGGDHRWRVTVAAGVVTIADCFDNATDRRVAEVLAGAVAGVVAVEVAFEAELRV
ncbi:CBS domain-containing protein [Solihabitans fulvus]|uniref:CBS domain-containing protein n=1 Tax=Solihabitans fulvus TaxID=1892852 RepID=A0A5B2XDM1_9PSEU|nr:CBS domain-containing protein [Solihabitans fulvus]KAA2261848.1 CBS domain-containing protein [Solihabitans fulvus]